MGTTARRETDLADQLVVVPVNADPEPDYSVRCLHSHGSVMEPHTCGPESTYFLKVQRRMLRVRLQKFKGFIGLPTDEIRKNVVASPEVRRSVMDQIFVDFPAAWD